ncbi:claudin 15-like a [Rhincodon typus]|uniref:claudin 15-like a n=1 Tax=Rhincodon typus TaxID=259920 RepID=UPI00202F281F|nr:claudin 15-like a [Rhincodon typus]
MAAAIETTGFLMGLAGWMLTGSTLANNYWKISTVFGSVITSSRLYENLWKSCAQDSTGVFNCRMFETMLGLSSYIQACRALMIISIILGVIATLVALFGLKCTNIGSMDEKAKGKISLSGGLVFILSGLCAIIPVSWYAYNITMEFYNPVYGGTNHAVTALPTRARSPLSHAFPALARSPLLSSSLQMSGEPPSPSWAHSWDLRSAKALIQAVSAPGLALVHASVLGLDFSLRTRHREFTQSPGSGT